MTSKNSLIAISLLVAVFLGFQAGRLSSNDGVLGVAAPASNHSASTAGNLTVPSKVAIQLDQAPSQAPSASPSRRGRLEPVIGIVSIAPETYVRAIQQCGGIPVVLPNTDYSAERIDQYLDVLDGLLMPGGADIPPSEYGEEKHPTANLLDEDRYRFDKAMAIAWINETDKPLLGICLGSQWINVAHGGSLVQDIPSEFGVSHRGTTHRVKLETNSRLAEIFGSTEFEVNSFHHQSVRRVGDGLRIVARCPEGIVEAVETTDDDRFLIGVQWHPEKLLPENRLQAKIIDAFIEAASKEIK